MMTQLRLVCLGASLVAGLCTPVAAAPVTLGRVTLDIPAGWERQESAGGLLLSRQFPETADDGKAAAMIQLMLSDQGPAALDANFATMVGMVPEFVSEDTMLDSAGTTMNGQRIRVEYRCCQYRQDISMGQTVAGIAAEDGQVLAAMVFMNVSSDNQQAADADFKAMVRSIRFSGDSKTALTPADGDGGLEGVFTHLATGLVPNAFGGVDFNAESEVTVFDKGGLFSHAIPTGGQSVADHCGVTPKDCGTYRLNGGGWLSGPDEIEMHAVADDYGVIDSEKLSFGRNGDDLLIDEGEYKKLPAFADGTTLDGSWTYNWASSGMTATGSGSVAVQRNLTLRKDGRFERDDWSGGSTSGQMGGVTVSSKRPASQGTYQVSGYELTLTGDDGVKETLSLFAPDIDSDKLLVIDGANYLKNDAEN